MTNFSHLRSLQVQQDTTVEFTFYRIGGEPTLSVRHAGQENRDFFNAALKKSKQAARRLRGRQGAAPSHEDIERARREDAALFAKHIVTGWEDVLDADGEAVEFSEEVCLEFLLAIPSDMFTELRAFCLDINNFREDDSMGDDELEELQGN